ncbi:helix-turn-helix domain-containing protein [Lysinibacillus sp. FSL H8-0500]|uniref:helix-turn-helix domain-containing protein n=1 Tax=Lysinibacillus sp. FSL H8-0500 TaxID=2921393 RepID=UPI0031014472
MTNNFGERLKMALKAAGYTQKKATEELELSKNAITNYVAGRIPDAQILYKLAQLCSVSMEWLLTGEDHPSHSTEKENSYEMELLQLFRRLSQEDQLRTLGYIESSIDKQDKKASSSSSIHGEETATDETA